MEFTTTYRRSLKTSRRYVFENIMDLNHVCVVHRRWFRNLRPTVRHPDYVEYRLEGRFYGMRQEVLASGGPIDTDRYWYEFRGPVATVRVDGMMEGLDGDLTLIEAITYRFPWPLAPFFWFLRGFFIRQKQDILRADGRLLERMLALEKAGFRRFEL